MMHLRLASFASTPYPHGQGVDVFTPTVYEDLLDNWPPESAFQTLTGAYTKLSLGERCHPKTYAAFVTINPVWRDFHAYLKSAAFIDEVFWELGWKGVEFPRGTYSARFEFSSLPSEGGAIAPHRDIPSKILTLVVPMTREAVPGWGTDILAPLGAVGKDYATPREAFRTVTSFDYAPNTCGLFVKTADSWHAIGPLKGPAGGWRRTLTINIESL